MPGINKNYEDLLKIYIESEIVNYNYHKHLYFKHKREKERLTSLIKIGPNASSSSVIAMPEANNHSLEADNLHLARRIDELEDKMKDEKVRIDCVDTWLAECCNTEKQRNVIKVYMIDNLSKDVDRVAEEELRCSRENVLKIRRKFINRIIMKKFS